MQMMYETIYKALVDIGLENEYEPQDYLNFFCLGNREAQDIGSSNAKSSGGNTPQVQLSRLLLKFHFICLMEKTSVNMFHYIGTDSEKPKIHDLCPFKRNDSGR